MITLFIALFSLFAFSEASYEYLVKTEIEENGKTQIFSGKIKEINDYVFSVTNIADKDSTKNTEYKVPLDQFKKYNLCQKFADRKGDKRNYTPFLDSARNYAARGGTRFGRRVFGLETIICITESDRENLDTYTYQNLFELWHKKEAFLEMDKISDKHYSGVCLCDKGCRLAVSYAIRKNDSQYEYSLKYLQDVSNEHFDKVTFQDVLEDKNRNWIKVTSEKNFLTLVGVNKYLMATGIVESDSKRVILTAATPEDNQIGFLWDLVYRRPAIVKFACKLSEVMRVTPPGYTGESLDGLRHGQGTQVSVEGTYTGQWKNDKKNGHGTANYVDGSSYSGEWKDNKYHGKGRMVFADGTVYEGEWEDNKESGLGTKTYPDGSVYRGQWKNGLRHGQGKLTRADGTIISGNWTNGESDIPQGSDRIDICDRGVIGEAIAKAIKLECNYASRKKMAELSSLDLSQLRISMLANNSFEGLTGLRMINLKGNKLFDLNPNLFKDLSKLNVLDLSYNSFNHIPKAVLNVTTLKNLDLSYNKLSVVPHQAFKGMTELSVVKLSNNQIHTIENFAFSGAPIEQLDLTFNQLQNLPTHQANGVNANSLIYYVGNPLIRTDKAVIAILDTALEVPHNRLYDKMYVNPFEGRALIPNGDVNNYFNPRCKDYDCRWHEYEKLMNSVKLDADWNSFKGDIYGYNFKNNNSSVAEKLEFQLSDYVLGRISYCQDLLEKSEVTQREYDEIQICIAEGSYYKQYTDHSHGSHVAGIASRVAPNSKLMGITILGPNQRYIDFNAVYRYLGSSSANVANCSFGRITKTYDRSMVDAYRRMLSPTSKILMVFAAGNDSLNLNKEEKTVIPAMVDIPWGITVAAVDEYGSLASFSNYGTKYIDVAAPGVSITSLGLGGLKGLIQSGTSQAAPYVSGVAANLYEACPAKFTPEVAKKIILETVDKKSWLVGKVKSGGIVNPTRALTAMKEYCKKDKNLISAKAKLQLVLSQLASPVDYNEPPTRRVLGDMFNSDNSVFEQTE